MIQDGTPLTYGILRPVILLPAHIVEKRESVSYVLLHEFTHIRRLDCLSKLLLTAALCLYWWNPLVWIMVHLANTDMEVACDEAVLQELGEDLRKHYAAMLVELESQRVSSSLLYSCFGKNATKERIHAMMKSKRMTRFSLILSAILAVATITVFATQAPLQNVTAEMAVLLPATTFDDLGHLRQIVHDIHPSGGIRTIGELRREHQPVIEPGITFQQQKSTCEAVL